MRRRANMRVRFSTPCLIHSSPLSLPRTLRFCLEIPLMCSAFVSVLNCLFLELPNRFQKTCTIFGYKRFYLFIATATAVAAADLLHSIGSYFAMHNSLGWRFSAAFLFRFIACFAFAYALCTVCIPLAHNSSEFSMLGQSHLADLTHFGI